MIHRSTGHDDPGLARVRNVIASLAVSGTVSLDLAAKSLGTSPRTLQRRLCDRGTCFWTIVEESRFEIAAALLRGTRLSVQEIGTRLGYGTPSAFSRAFVKWAGMPPRAFRLAAASSAQSGAGDWREMGRTALVQPVVS
jgi:AraC-like DNA-binding protein